MNSFTKLVLVIIPLGLFTSTIAYAQEENYDSLLNYYLKSDSILLDQLEYELAADSMDILDLMDSLLYTDFRISQMAIRVGYTSNITYAGRNFGIDQHGFGFGASYYHKTGLFADVSGYWNSDIMPNYNPTIITAGYLGKITRKWTYTLSYDHFFYQVPEEEQEITYYPITNSLNASTYYELGKFTLAADYSYLFGEESAHRARGNLMYTFSKSKWGFIDRFVFMPTASALFGNAFIYQVTPIYPSFNRDTRIDIRHIMINQWGEDRVRYMWRHNRDTYLNIEKEIYDQYKSDFVEYLITSENVFGLMNYSLSAPFFFYINNFTFSLSYHYNIPVALPGEELNLEPNSFVGTALIYNIPFRKKSK